MDRMNATRHEKDRSAAPGAEIDVLKSHLEVAEIELANTCAFYEHKLREIGIT